MNSFDDVFVGKSGKDKFAEVVIAALRQAGAMQKLRYDQRAFRIVVEHGDCLHLHKVYKEFCNATKINRQQVLRRYVRGWLGAEYDRQQKLIEALHEMIGLTIFVASYWALELKDTGEIFSCSVWSKGVDTLLPRTDVIHFCVPKGKDREIAVSATWERVMQVVGDLLERQGMYPERYRVTGFPTESQLIELGQPMLKVETQTRLDGTPPGQGEAMESIASQ